MEFHQSKLIRTLVSLFPVHTERRRKYFSIGGLNARTYWMDSKITRSNCKTSIFVAKTPEMVREKLKENADASNWKLVYSKIKVVVVRDKLATLSWYVPRMHADSHIPTEESRSEVKYRRIQMRGRVLVCRTTTRTKWLIGRICTLLRLKSCIWWQHLQSRSGAHLGF